MDPVDGPAAPKEVLPLIVPFDISEVTKQLQDATLMWSGTGSVEVELRGPNDRVVLYFTPMRYRDSCSVLIQARKADDRAVALSLERVNLYAVIISNEDQDPIPARPEAHAISLSDIQPGVQYLLQISNPPTVARGTVETLPGGEYADEDEGARLLFSENLPTSRSRRGRQGVLLTV